VGGERQYDWLEGWCVDAAADERPGAYQRHHLF
jgi:hypothetical protein